MDQLFGLQHRKEPSFKSIISLVIAYSSWEIKIKVKDCSCTDNSGNSIRHTII